MKYAPKKLIIPIMAQRPIFFQLPLHSSYNFLLFWRGFTSKYVLLSRFSSYLRWRCHVPTTYSLKVKSLLRNAKIRSDSGLHPFEGRLGIKLSPNSNAWLAIKGLREKLTTNDLNRPRDASQVWHPLITLEKISQLMVRSQETYDIENR